MQFIRPGTRWRYAPKGATSLGRPSGFPAPPSGPQSTGPKAAWIFLCPNSFCDTELVLLPEQAGAWVECPTCHMRFMVPHPAPFKPASRTGPPQLSAEESKAAGALESLAKSSHQPGTHAAPARVRPSAASVAAGSAERRAAERLSVGQQRPTPGGRASKSEKRSDLAMTWLVAVMASAGIIVAGALSRTPDLALGSLVFVGLAIVRTAMVLRRREA